jgi:uncharacterized Ntn-hydrolase superfamily protein
MAAEGKTMTLIPAHTYSIVARDPETNQLGVAVQSHYFCVGGIVPWAEAGVGAVATQSFAEASYGPLGLEMMRAGKSAEQALTGLLASDPQAHTRQVAMVDIHGNTAAHTGHKCIEAAGHRQGAGYSVQANLMLKDTVWDAMAEAYEAASRRPGADLAERLVQALEAAEAEGGDIRGKQSAALLVVTGEPTGRPWSDRLFDLRVDDHSDPLGELRRLLAISRAYRHGDRAERLLVEGTAGDNIEAAAQEFNKAAELMPDADANPELHYWHAVALANSGRVDDALPIFRKVFALDPAWRDLIPRLARADLLPGDQEIIDKITRE